jgi:glutathione S-transferase
VEFKDIPMTMKCKVGASTTEGGRYTLPVIKDPNTGSVVADSLAIAEYLDKTYPEKPIIPRGANVLMPLFEPAYCRVAYGKAVKLILTKTLEIMNDSNREYFIRTRLELLGETRWEVVSEENVQQQWEDLKKGLDEIDKWYQKSGGKWIMGDTFSFADMVVACRIMWWNTIFDEDQVRELHSWNDGRWARLLADVNAECGTNL